MGLISPTFGCGGIELPGVGFQKYRDICGGVPGKCQYQYTDGKWMKQDPPLDYNGADEWLGQIIRAPSAARLSKCMEFTEKDMAPEAGFTTAKL